MALTALIRGGEAKARLGVVTSRKGIDARRLAWRWR
nr:MAG TPA: hypothetical protein [Caudoviricetes sp.]